ncbi:MAG: hypothetical protein ACK56F_15600 [bacterium]
MTCLRVSGRPAEKSSLSGSRRRGSGAGGSEVLRRVMRQPWAGGRRHQPGVRG